VLNSHNFHPFFVHNIDKRQKGSKWAEKSAKTMPKKAKATPHEDEAVEKFTKK